ncbi:MAG: shikimate dehydrogenase [Flavobacteriales bacterium]|nr:shikimate dehydrogenase [Flavobacteriales bacterium]
MKTFGLIGYPLKHSFSKNYFEKKFKEENISHFQYINFESEKLEKLFENELLSELSGFNVTIPFKESIIPFLDDIDESAKEINAVNCVKRVNDKLIGHNTDYIGFKKSIKPLLNNTHKKALILGSGGASKAIIYALKELKIEYKVISRKSEFNYHSIDKKTINNHQIIINCTPLGTYPDIHSFPPIPYEYLSENHLLYDLVYNPEETEFLKKGKYYNCQTKNGLEMLQIQAEKSYIIWSK